nr:YdcF family protein [Schlegelella koreensis]
MPFLVLIVVGAWFLARRRRLGWGLVASGVALVWLSASAAVAGPVSHWLLPRPPALTEARIAELRAEARGNPPPAIVVLGGGIEGPAAEYGARTLNWRSLERLRYGLYLAQKTHAPVLFTGGVGWADTGGTSEASAAAKIAAEEFGRPLRWLEDRARDTRENARYSVEMLRAAGVRHVLLVTHGYHMPRALRAFNEAAAGTMRIEPAPMGLARRSQKAGVRWLPTNSGYGDMRDTVHELLGLLAGA